MNKTMPEHWDDVKLAKFLRVELNRLEDDLAMIHVAPWMFQRMAEIVVGHVQDRSEDSRES